MAASMSLRGPKSLAQRTVTVRSRTFEVVELAVVALAALGLLLALPSVVWPTSRLVLSDPGRGTVLSDQRLWSWGQVSATSGGEFDRVFADGAGLWFFVAVLVVGAAAVLFWVWRSSPAGCLLGVLGLTVPTAYLAAVVVQRLGSRRVEAYDLTGLGAESVLQPAAVTEGAATVVLVVSLVALVLLTLRSPHRLGRVTGKLELGNEPAVEAGREEAVHEDEAGPAAEPAPPSSTKVDGIRTSRDGTTAAPGGPRLTGPDTDFRDEPPDRMQRPRRPDHRFEPPT